MKKILCMLLAAVLCICILGNLDVQAAKKINLGNDDENSLDIVNYDYYKVKAEKTYYVGQQKSSYLEKNKGKYDKVLYFGDTYYLGDDAKSYKISNTKIAKIVGDEIIPLKQGIFTLTTPSNKKINIAVTTYNDGKNPVTARSQARNGWYTYCNAFDAEDAKARIHTISDAIDILKYRWFKYSYCEPYSQWVDGWTWLQSGKSIYDYNTGVCADISQLMCYLLVEDFEDMGVIWISGEQGHAFNYYFEDGYYYIFDATQVISDLMYDQQVDTEEYQKRIVKCKSIEDIKNHVFNEKGIKKDTNYLVNMVSVQGHDYTPVSLTTGCQHYLEEIYNDKVSIEWGLDEVAYKGMVILWQDPNVNLEVKSISSDDIPLPIRMSRTAVYCSTVKAVKKNL